MIEKAMKIAECVHKNQVDKSGKPYIEHIKRVVSNCNSEVEKTCAALHDVVEDSNFTFEDLKNEGISSEVIEVLKFLTREKSDSYDAYIDKILLNKTACHVKLADLTDNMNISRIENPTEKDFQRVKKYESAYNKIFQHINADLE